MSPNTDSMTKFSQSDESINDIINELKKLVLEEKRTISYTYVSQRFRIHVSRAVEVLDQFVAEERNNGNNLWINYLLSGNNDNSDNDNEIKMDRFMIINDSDMDSAVKWYTKGFEKQIYSVCATEENDSIDLNFDEYECVAKTEEELKDLQNLTYVKNPNIEFRTTRRRRGIKPSVQTTEEEIKCEQTKSASNVKTESNGRQPKIKTNGRTKNRKKISNMFSKNKKEITEEVNEDKDFDDVKRIGDPFESGSDEEVLEIEDNEKNEDSMDNRSESEKEVKNKNVRKDKNKKKRQSKSSSDEEEVIVSKKRSKKFKRVRLISDSDSDEPKEETAIDKFVGSQKEKSKNSKPRKRVEARQETHVDEDGYTVTQTVKKEVEEKDSDSEEKQIESKESKETKTKSKRNENKNIEKKVEKKTKPIKETKSKSKSNPSSTQSSITSFFKPKPVST